jgi:hypothetical protein
MESAPRIIISRISQIPLNVEWLFNTKSIRAFLLSATRMPHFFFSWNAFSLAYRYNLFLIIDFVSILSEEVKQQLANSFVVRFPKPTELFDIVSESRVRCLAGRTVNLSTRKLV